MFKSGKIAFYDDEKMLYYCYIGVDDKNQTLVAAAYGQTEEDAISNALAITSLLNKIQIK